MDGSQVVSFSSPIHLPDRSEGIMRRLESGAKKRHLEDFLIPFGYGDGGGTRAGTTLSMPCGNATLKGCPR